jgi:hypothetical protein
MIDSFPHDSVRDFIHHSLLCKQLRRFLVMGHQGINFGLKIFQVGQRIDGGVRLAT